MKKLKNNFRITLFIQNLFNLRFLISPSFKKFILVISSSNYYYYEHCLIDVQIRFFQKNCGFLSYLINSKSLQRQ